MPGAKLYTLQQFRPQEAWTVSWQEIKPYRREDLEAMAARCRAYVEEVRVVNV
jgi:hypothetical protein